MDEKDRCPIQIWVKDCLRRTGRGPSGFEMHYNRDRCSRRAKVDGMCRQHAKMKAQGWNLSNYA